MGLPGNGCDTTGARFYAHDTDGSLAIRYAEKGAFFRMVVLVTLGANTIFGYVRQSPVCPGVGSISLLIRKVRSCSQLITGPHLDVH